MRAGAESMRRVALRWVLVTGVGACTDFTPPPNPPKPAVAEAYGRCDAYNEHGGFVPGQLCAASATMCERIQFGAQLSEGIP